MGKDKKKSPLRNAIHALRVPLFSCKGTTVTNHEAESVRTDESYRAIAYVTVPASEHWRWIGVDKEEVVSHVDTRYVTHINFAFGMLRAYQFDTQRKGCPKMAGAIVAKEAYKNPKDQQYHYKATVNGWIAEMKQYVEGGKYLHALVKLKEKKPDLKVLLSIGGWASDGFCYMSRTRQGRLEFIYSCMDLMDEYKLDGIDLDWEYPGGGKGTTIASCEHCIEDANHLLKEFRKELDLRYGKVSKLVSIASAEPWVDDEAFQAIDYVNVMCYDYDPGSGNCQAPMPFVKSRMERHMNWVGDTIKNRSKVNLGVPFFNEGGSYLVPFFKPWSGYVDASAKKIRKKMIWAKRNRYGGGFCWAYSMDKFEQDVKNPGDEEVKILQRTLYETLNNEKR